ncbi:DUF736 domain-containing protein [Edaphosphingomonas haloaromaticamans]|uniref:DUF736 domain-containing protein n=1 Tax=Edaphosphingomonas haloaromaticamans TaxID=653954 RepID=A0A1S1HCW5_9SPHN|nr:DUF736 domain-containing protein [Sphingomonas haloaromaticamans]OHT20069.1 hypothetical protein BHE75_02063 [Sphingomonas haloaromaticamans]TNE43198.1 MAG: DUF736 domain-containing protein [Sphingomonadales bacterium]
MQPNIFKPTADGYSGRIRLLGIDEALVLVPADQSDAENAPDYRVLLDDANGPRIGAGWKEVGEKAGEYVSMEIESPLFAQQSLRAHLFRVDDEGTAFRLSISRPRSRDERN